VTCGDEPSGSVKSGNFLASWGPVRYSRRTVLYVVCLLVRMTILAGIIVN
jgi:hypothetical protein